MTRGVHIALRALPGALLLALLAVSCREGVRAVSFVPVVPGASGCNASTKALVGPVAVDIASCAGCPILLGVASHVAADRLPNAAGRAEVFVTAGDGSVWKLEFDDGAPDVPAVVTQLIVSADVSALPEYAGQPPPSLSGLALLESLGDRLLVVVEHTQNLLLIVDADTPGEVHVFPSLVADPAGGFADTGLGQPPRFRLTAPVQPLASPSGRVFLPDPGNDALRALDVQGGAVSVFTIAGSGAPGFRDGSLQGVLLDTPVAVTVGCGGTLLVVETGAGGAGGHRLRELQLGQADFFGGLDGSGSTLAGDGQEASVEGVGAAASLAGPMAVTSTNDGSGLGPIYWIDSTGGILRRLDAATGLVDCPLDAGCVASGALSAGGVFSLAVSAHGVLYVLDAGAGSLLRVSAP